MQSLEPACVAGNGCVYVDCFFFFDVVICQGVKDRFSRVIACGFGACFLFVDVAAIKPLVDGL